MALIALASGRSPGLTTTAYALAAMWPPPRQALLAELDPDGGTLAATHATTPDPGLNTLASSGRHHLGVEVVAAHLQQAPGGPPVLLASPSPDRTVAAIETLNRVDLPGVLRCLPEFDVIADCGRIDSRSPSLPVLRGADVVLFVVRPAPEDVIALQHRLETLDLSSRQTKAGIVAVGDRPYGGEEVSAAFSLPVVGVIEWDSRAAQALGEGRPPATSSRLLRSAGRLARDIAAQVEPPQAMFEGQLEGSIGDAGGGEDDGIPSPVWAAMSTGSDTLASRHGRSSA